MSLITYLLQFTYLQKMHREVLFLIKILPTFNLEIQLLKTYFLFTLKIDNLSAC